MLIENIPMMYATVGRICVTGDWRDAIDIRNSHNT